MKDVGLVGVPYSGTSTLFTALTRAGSHGGQANVAVVSVPDARLRVLTDMERSAKTVAASGSLRRRAGRGLERPGHRSTPRGRCARGGAPVLRRRAISAQRAGDGPVGAAARRPRRDRERPREGREEGSSEARSRGRRPAAREGGARCRDGVAGRRHVRRRRGPPARHRSAHAEARGRRGQPRGRHGGTDRSRVDRHGRRLRVDRGRDGRDGRPTRPVRCSRSSACRSPASRRSSRRVTAHST